MNSPPLRPRPYRFGFAGAVAIGWCSMFVIGTELFVLSPLLPLIAADFAISVATAGWCVTVFSLANMATCPFFGDLADCIGRRRMVMIGLSALAVANGLVLSAPAFAWLLAAYLVAGVASAASVPAIYALVGEGAEPERRGTWLAIVVSGLLIALSTGAPLGGLLGTAYGWRRIFIALAALSLLAGIGNFLAWPAGPAKLPGAGAAAEARFFHRLAPRLVPTLLWAAAIYAFYTYLGAGLQRMGITGTALARALVIYGIGAIFGVIGGGRLTDRVGARTTAATSLFGLAAFFALLAAILQANLVSVLLLGFVSASAQAFFPAQQVALTRDFPRRRASVLAWNNSALYLGIALGALAGGHVFAAGFAANLALAALFALAAFAATLWTMPRAAR